MRTLIELGLDLISWITCPPEMLRGRVLRVRIASLDHETLDDAMKCGAVVKTLAGKLLEVFNSFGSYLRPEADDHFSLGCFDNGDFGIRTHVVRFRRARQGTVVTDLM